MAAKTKKSADQKATGKASKREPEAPKATANPGIPHRASKLQVTITELMKCLESAGDLKKHLLFNDLSIKELAVCDAAQAGNEEFLQALFGNKVLRELYFTKDSEYLPPQFKLTDFLSIFRLNKYHSNSLTLHDNKIGLFRHERLHSVNDVVMNFPYKDCILEASLSEKDEGDSIEEFHHETYSVDEVNRIREPKAFCNAERIDKKGRHQVTNLLNQDNLLIKGNNLVCLYSLLPVFRKKVKLIYIDPPYNTEDTSGRLPYNDKFNHSTWLLFMKNRLEVARELLADDGLLFMQIDEREHAYLRVLADEVFDRKNFVNEISVKMSEASGPKMSHVNKKLPKLKETILLYKRGGAIHLNEVKLSGDKWDSEYKYFLTAVTDREIDEIHKLYDQENLNDKDLTELNRLLKKIGSTNVNNLEDYKTLTDVEKEAFLIKNSKRIIRDTSASSVVNLALSDLKNNKIASSVNFRAVRSKEGLTYIYKTQFNQNATSPRIQVLFASHALETNIGDFWKHIKTTGIEPEGGVDLKNGKKPEQLLYTILSIGTNPGDLVMDFFAGSGTTAAVALKMGRKFITIEQMDYIEDITKKRLHNVVMGDQTGVSKICGWEGGGSFVYLELKEVNQQYSNGIRACRTPTEVIDYYTNVICKNALLNSKFENSVVDAINAQLNTGNVAAAKTIILGIIDKNFHYLPVSEMKDARFEMSKEDIATTESFCGETK